MSIKERIMGISQICLPSYNLCVIRTRFKRSYPLIGYPHILLNFPCYMAQVWSSTLFCFTWILGYTYPIPNETKCNLGQYIKSPYLLRFISGHSICLIYLFQCHLHSFSHRSFTECLNIW